MRKCDALTTRGHRCRKEATAYHPVGQGREVLLCGEHQRHAREGRLRLAAANLDLSAIQRSMAKDNALAAPTRAAIAAMPEQDFRQIWDTMANVARMPADRAVALAQMMMRYNAGERHAVNLVRNTIRTGTGHSDTSHQF